MTSRERVLRAVNHEKPDRVPIDLGAIRASGINAVVYDSLKKRLDIHTPTKIHDTMQILAEVELDVLDRIHGDIVPLDANDAAWVRQPADEGAARRLFCGLEVYFQPGTAIDEEADGSWALRRPEGEIYARMPKDGYYFDFTAPTMASTRIDPDAFRPSMTVPDEQLEAMASHARWLHDNTDKAILGWAASLSVVGLSHLLAANITQGSLDQWLLMLMTEKETANEMMGRAVDAVIAQTQLYHETVGDRCFAWGVGSDDAGTQRGEFLSPDLFAEMVAPHYKRLCDWVHANTSWKTYLHSCGSIYGYIQEWIDAGIDILNPVQISAANMEPHKLMEEFGGQVVFWGGGCDTQHVLPNGTPEEIREHVRENLSIFASGNGGYVFTQVHNIQQTVPVENVEAMLVAAHEFG
ncbi:MAG: uroporphyrinogen decarboxylase family protein [Candidatus Latescibacteria bacterium]|nr:uroporphyrinogen decarboxylase family protein [Candidatus Latescibacterota bacterium]